MAPRLGSPGRPFWFPSVVIMLLVMLSSVPAASFQTPSEDYTALRNRAFELWERQNPVGALPYLEKLAAMRPDDTLVLIRLAYSLVSSTAAIQDTKARKQAVLRARSLLLRAKELGAQSNLMEILLEKIPESGELSEFSTRQEVDEAVREGEAAYATSDFAKAIACYQRALELDPRNYSATLFTGDVYFSMNQMDQAGKWFERAIQIDPNRETAYRYWGDALLKEGKLEEAKERFIQAIVAEPYTKTAWIGLQQWAGKAKAKLSHPRIESPSVMKPGHKGNVTITIDFKSLKKEDGTEYWMWYQLSRAAWQGERFKKEFPNEASYRHSLREEVEALDVVAEMVAEDVKKHEIKRLDPSLATLLELREQGLLEAYALISRADEGIAKDYADYRAANREKLHRYIVEYVISEDKSDK
jgi:tetratricopeptide (TPR) repeat protein